MRVPIYVHSESLTSPSVYPFLGYFDVLCVGEHATVRCSGHIGHDASPQDVYFVSRYIEEKIRKIISITISQEEVEDFFYHFWTGFIHSEFSLDDEIQESEIHDNIAMFVAWQPLNNSEPEDKEHRLEIPICISGIGLLQLFAVPYVETLTEKNQKDFEWAPIVQMPHPFSTARKTRKVLVIYLFKHLVGFELHNVVFKSNLILENCYDIIRKSRSVWKSKEWWTDVVERL